jgi:LPS sulfotransferase NodH
MIRFVVLATPRTGSNWLCSLLDSHPDILCHHEIFNPEGIHYALSARGGELDFGTVTARDREPLHVLDRVWHETLGFPVVGFKLNRGQNPMVLNHVLLDQEVRKIVIKRANRIRTFVSEQIAELTGEWESYRESHLSGKKIAVTVDPAELHRHVFVNQRFYEDIHASLTDTEQSAIEVHYEKLADPHEVARVLAFLGVSPAATLTAGTRKQNPSSLHQLVSNIDDLRIRLEGSELEQDLYFGEFQ